MDHLLIYKLCIELDKSTEMFLKLKGQEISFEDMGRCEFSPLGYSKVVKGQLKKWALHSTNVQCLG